MERSGGHIDSEEFTTPTEVKLVKMKCLLCRRFMTGSLTTGSRPQLGSTLAPGRHTRLRGQLLRLATPSLKRGQLCGHGIRVATIAEVEAIWSGDREPTDRASPARSQSAVRLSSVGIHVSKANRRRKKQRGVNYNEKVAKEVSHVSSMGRFSLFNFTWAYVALNDDQETRPGHRIFFAIFNALQGKLAGKIQ
ncbi:hypothetical protein PSTT_16691 [Puccinia striiformis]|uniref:Uncharacterized protein n=2 Tax=Puccinia striiformis TaxID=27350 RepID=A0A0L0UWK0_9BASI|nr:hypothetical protein PSTG_15460 [Puccinia striiformis f. sp. tritici PST-78]POV94727.1 hypothetical protein PSTT_16691 [Puccinia striiformis]